MGFVIGDRWPLALRLQEPQRPEVMPYKRGTKVGDASTYHTYAGDVRRVPRELADLARRRTEPFLDSVGMGKPLATLMQEAYFQGIKDAISVTQPEPAAPA